MKIWISADIEGATGVVHHDALSPEGHAYGEACRRMTADVVAAAEGALDAGAELVVVTDGHGGMRNIELSELPAGVHLLRGPASSRRLCQAEGVDSSFDAALFVGYHAMEGSTPAVVAHTWAGAVVREIRLDGRRVGETGINAAVAGHHGVPVVLVSGDDAVVREAEELLPGITTVTTKTAIGYASAICRPPSETLPELRTAARSAVTDADNRRPLRHGSPVVAEVDLSKSSLAERAARYTDVERVGDFTVRIVRETADDAVAVAWAAVEVTMMEHGAWNR